MELLVECNHKLQSKQKIINNKIKTREISIEEAKKALAELKENPEKLIEYINNIQLKKATNNIERTSRKF